MTPERLSYAVPPWLVAVLAAVAAIAVAAAFRSADPPGRFFYGVLAAAATVEALRAALLRPTLTADADGLTVATGLRVERHPWSAVAAVTVLGAPESGARLRRRANALEVDLGERLVVVPAYRLGRPAAEVAAAVADVAEAAAAAARSRGGGGGF